MMTSRKRFPSRETPCDAPVSAQVRTCAKRAHFRRGEVKFHGDHDRAGTAAAVIALMLAAAALPRLQP